jgi:hypothetical protein
MINTTVTIGNQKLNFGPLEPFFLLFSVGKPNNALFDFLLSSDFLFQGRAVAGTLHHILQSEALESVSNDQFSASNDQFSVFNG